MRRSLALIAIPAIALACFAFTVHAKKPDKPGDGGGGGAAYTIVPFSPPGVQSVSSYVGDLNDSGQAAGGFERADGTSQAIHLDLGSGDYTSLQGGANSSAGDVNNLNQIAGETNGIGAFWDDPDAVPVPLPPIAGHTESWGHRVNDAGVVIGGSTADGLTLRTPVVWRVLPDGNGTAVHGPYALPFLPGGNNATTWGAELTEVTDGLALVVGWSADATSYQAVIWTLSLNGDGTVGPIGPPMLVGSLGLSNPSFSEASSINEFGEISGRSDYLPFIAAIDQAPEPLPVPRNTLDANALDINNSGDCVGYVQIQFKGSNIPDGPRYAYLWNNGEAIDLAKEIPKQSGWEYLTWAGSINDAGLIAGFGRFDVSRRGFILIPNEP